MAHPYILWQEALTVYPPSGIALTGDVQILLLARREGCWRPISAALRGTYDRLGGVDEPEDQDPSFDAFGQWAKQVLGAEDLSDALERMRDGQAAWNGQELSYALVDARLYEALPDDLLDADPDLPVVLQHAWKAAVADVEPIDVEDSEQYCGLSGSYGCQNRIDAALEQFASNPGLFAAIEANANDWRELDEEN